MLPPKLEGGREGGREGERKGGKGERTSVTTQEYGLLAEISKQRSLMAFLPLARDRRKEGRKEGGREGGGREG